MGTNVHLTPELEHFARERVSEGRYNNVSEVVREGLRLLQDQEEARRSAAAAAIEAEAAERRLIAERRAHLETLKRRWDSRPSVDVGAWTRDELYD